MAYEILPIGVRERHHDVKARIFRYLAEAELRRLRKRADDELRCVVPGDIKSDDQYLSSYLALICF